MSLGYVLLVLAIYVLAVARIVRLVNHDTVADGVRLIIARRAANADQAATEAEQFGQIVRAETLRQHQARWNTLLYFIQCPWCVGWWLALATAILPVLIIGWPWWTLFGVAFATSHLIGIAAPLAADEEITVEQA